MVETNWNSFLLPYSQAIAELKIKLRSIRAEFIENGEHSPIEYVTGRVKSVDSIKEKMKRRYISADLLEQDMQDIAGLRIQCQFVEDIYQIVDILHDRTDLAVVEERDYVTNSKPSGYRSYHIVLQYPVQQASGVKNILVEIQIRTLAMNFWSTIEHSLNYKYQGDFPEDINSRLKRAAEASFMLDEEMSKIREEIQDAQKYFTHSKSSDFQSLKGSQQHEGVDSKQS
ncbi:GTP pyrophosphokinase [Bombilactobacillus thymidiniphilus]|uniref:GTP pyrophosphokinase family protein n=1 Tax=Bombilactobacillus thymidiniphilus TaxID=2923363 RepID=A0ABY4PDC1_9LACO|nr:GTP pyrophosphokinase family protein [Bombilactobacillus thymidiniphilus]UQS83277.1 GTP pyrophosphokinase family protein [Bombilactobacillus thymidiniphilus]